MAGNVTENSGKQRGRPFVAGASGNPGGRPKVDVEVRALAQQQAPDAIARLVELMRCGNPAVEVRAAEALLDRAIGKPRQAIEFGGLGEVAELMREIAERRSPESNPIERAKANRARA